MRGIPYQKCVEFFTDLRPIGHGGMGSVQKARSKTLHRAVAIKRILVPAHLTDEYASALERFDREAKILAQLRHPNVVAIDGLFRDEQGAYLVMEYVEGGTLRDRMLDGPLDWKESVRLILPVCVGLAAAHNQNIVHRDIKPANILLPGEAEAKLADFGLARSEDFSRLTQSGQTLGTLLYMAPEQLRDGCQVDVRADVYSLAATLFHMVTGAAPLGVLNPDKIPEPLRPLLLAALAENPEQRPPSARHLGDALRKVLGRVEEKPEHPREDGSPAGAKSKWQAPALKMMSSPEVAAGEQGVWADYFGLAEPTCLWSGMRFRLIPPGHCLIGSPSHVTEADSEERPQLKVTVSRPLLVMEFPVTCGDLRGQAEELMHVREYSRWDVNAGSLPAGLPAVDVGLPLAAAFIETIHRQSGLLPRLPTEGEWEYFARAGSGTRYWWGDTFREDLVVFKANSPAVAAPRRANTWGLIDMLGNVAEWTASPYDKLDSGAALISAPATGLRSRHRSVRGGDYREEQPRHLRTACRKRVATDSVVRYIGFRLVLDAEMLLRAGFSAD